jgi:hypothetical protein
MKTTQTKFGVLVGFLVAVSLTAPSAGAAAAIAGGLAGGAAGNAGLSRPELPSAAAAGMGSAAAGFGRDPFAAGNAASDAALSRQPFERTESAGDESPLRRRNSPASASTGLNANASAHASAEGRTHGLAIAAAASGGLTTSLAADETQAAIHRTGFAERAKLTTDIEARLQASEKLVAELEADAKGAEGKSRSALAKSVVEIRKQQKEVRASLKAAAKAAEKNWGKVQSELAKSYGDLAQVVANAEVTAKASTTATADTGKQR